MRNLGLIGALVVAMFPAPALAQGDFVKSKLKNLIEKSGIYVSAGTRTSPDNDVRMGPSFGIGYGLAGRQRTGRKYPFSISKYGADLQTSGGNGFGRFTAHQLMSGVGYAWVRGKMTYGAQLGLGYSFNSVALDPGVGVAFGVTDPVAVSVSNSWVVRPKVKAEYFVTRKMSLRSELSYSYTDPDVVIHTTARDYNREWRPHHVQLSFAVGFFPFRK
jgi:hypothetical protein